MSYGAFARIEAGVEGLIHASEMALEPNQTPREILFEGQELQVRILHLDPSHQRMGLSLLLKSYIMSKSSEPQDMLRVRRSAMIGSIVLRASTSTLGVSSAMHSASC